MATISNVKSVLGTLTATTVDSAQLLQPWDQVEVTNLDGTNSLTVTDDGSTDPSSGLEGAVVIPPSQTKILKARQLRYSVPNGSTVFHEIRVLGNGGSYQVCGLASSLGG